MNIVDAIEACSSRTGIAGPAVPPPAPGEPGFAWQGRVLEGVPIELKHCVLAGAREWTEPCREIRAAWAGWCRDNRLLEIDYRWIEAPLDEALDLVSALSDCEHDELCEEAYRQFVEQCRAMYELLTRYIGITVEAWDEREGNGDDPYPSAHAQIRDIIENGHLWVNRGEFFIGEDPESPTGTKHPWLTADEYFVWRAVHDGFGHSAIGSGFDRHGEYAAWLVHCSMFEHLGRLAMTTEARGVNTHLWVTGTPLPADRYGVLLPERFLP